MMTTNNGKNDKLAWTFEVDIDVREKYELNLEMAVAEYSEKIRVRPTKKNIDTGFKNNYKVEFMKNGKPKFSMILSIHPADENLEIPIESRRRKNFSRIELNPSGIGRKGTSKIYKFLESVLGSSEAAKIYAGSRVTRVDICVDRYVNKYKSLKNIFPYYPRMEAYKKYPKEGKLESIVLGGGTSSIRITIYDKNKQAAKKNRKINGTHVTYHRVEARFKNLRCSLKTLNAEIYKSRFCKLVIFGKSLLEDEYFSKKFRRNVKAVGINNSLAELDGNIRKCYLRRLKARHKKNDIFDVAGIDTKNFFNFLDPFHKV